LKYFPAIFAKRTRLLASVFLGAILLMGAGDSARVDKLGHKLICMCGCNQVLLECNHYGCPYLMPMQKELTESVAAGKGDQQILQAFIDEYGTVVLAAPTTQGFDLVAWLMPYAALALGIAGVVLVVWVWHSRRRMPAPVSSTPHISPDLDRFREQARQETEL
jgi:cytochrome c-type biogenesis protein CcmH